MAGIVDTEVGKGMPGGEEQEHFMDDDPLKAKGVGYDPEKRSVASNETVAGQLDSVLATDSPLLQRARARASETANSRGLLNSTMAAQAGEAAVIDQALPIASADAQTYGTAARENQAAKNRSLEFGAGATNAAESQNVSEAGQTSRMKLGSQLEKGIIEAQTTAASTLSAQQAKQQQSLATVQGEIESGLITTREQADARLRQLTGEIEKELVGKRAEAEAGLVAQKAALDKSLQELRGTQATDLANIEANYKQLITASASAGSMFSDAIKTMTVIMADTATSTEQKQAAIDTITKQLQTGLKLVAGINSIDISGLIDFTAPAVPAGG